MRARSRASVTGAAMLALLLAACGDGGGLGEGRDGVGAPATRFLHIHGLAVDGSGTLFVATHGGLIRRTAEGSWVYATGDRNDHMGFSMDPRTGTMFRSGHSPSRPSLGVETSTDGGKTWSRLADVANPPVDFHAMAVSFADGKTLWGWDSGGRGTFRSTEGGRTWSRLDPQGIERQIFVLAGPPEPNVVLAGTASGLYRSTDGGDVWRGIDGVSGGWVIAVAADPKDPKHLLAFTQRGMKVTRDGGLTWTDAGGDLPGDAEITSLAISPADPNVAYAAAVTTVFRTNDGGKTWSVLRSE